MSEQRYYVDERIGCVAVRDRKNTDPDYQGLHSDTQGVVWYRHGGLVDGTPCPTCNVPGGKTWNVAEADINAATKECERLKGANGQ